MKVYVATKLFKTLNLPDNLLVKELEASEPKWVNPILNNIGLTHLGSETFI